MASLQRMPAIVIGAEALKPFGDKWTENGGALSRTPPYSSTQLGYVFDAQVGLSLATMLGGIEVVKPNSNSLIPAKKDVVEVGAVRIVGGVRPQNFDAGYRPDGVRFAFDSKTLNDSDSVVKNYQNMINDLGTEATTVHTRFPYAVVAFMVIIPASCLVGAQRQALTRTLERLTDRIGPIDLAHKAEAISLVLWDPATGEIHTDWPPNGSTLRLESFAAKVEAAYVDRYKGLPPHDEEEVAPPSIEEVIGEGAHAPPIKPAVKAPKKGKR